MQEMNQNQMPGTTGNKGQTELAPSFQGREKETERGRQRKRERKTDSGITQKRAGKCGWNRKVSSYVWGGGRTLSDHKGWTLWPSTECQMWTRGSSVKGSDSSVVL